MRHLEILAQVRGGSAATIYPILCDFGRFPELSDAVRRVSITEVGDDRMVSTWEVNFHQGILRWTEQDTFEHDSHTIHFRQLEGDAEYFAGAWVLSDNHDGCLIRFVADVDLGIPGLSDLLEPIAEQALRHNIRSILSGLIQQRIEFVVVEAPA